MSEEDAAALMMGDTQQPLLSSPSTGDMAQTPMSVMKRGEERGGKNGVGGRRGGGGVHWHSPEMASNRK